MTSMTVRKLDAKALWWHDAEPCPAPDEHLDFDCDHDAEAGWTHLRLVPVGTTPYITDGQVAFPAHLLDNAPLADDLTEVDADSRYSTRLTQYLSDEGRPHPSSRWFMPTLLDVIEPTGYRVRPLRTMANVHGICDPDLVWRVVGVVVGVVVAIDANATDVIGRVAL